MEAGGQMKEIKAAKEGGVSGTELLCELSEATGLPNELIGEELSRLISASGKSTDSVSLDDLRELLGAYLQDVLVQAKDAFENDASIHDKQSGDSGGVVVSMVQKFGDKFADKFTDSTSAEKNTATFAVFNDLDSSAAEILGEG